MPNKISQNKKFCQIKKGKRFFICNLADWFFEKRTIFVSGQYGEKKPKIMNFLYKKPLHTGFQIVYNKREEKEMRERLPGVGNADYKPKERVQKIGKGKSNH